MCYNAANHWALNWYGNAKLDLSNPPATPRQIKVAAFVDHQRRSANEYVLVKAGNLFMQYNRAKDYNSGTLQYANKLVIVQQTSAAQPTRLLAGLDASSNRVYRGSGVVIEVCSVQQRSGVDYMVVSIGKTRTDCGGGGSSNYKNQPTNKNTGTSTTSWNSWKTSNQNNNQWKTSWTNNNNNNQNKNTGTWKSWRSNYSTYNWSTTTTTNQSNNNNKKTSSWSWNWSN